MDKYNFAEQLALESQVVQHVKHLHSVKRYANRLSDIIHTI